MDNQAHVNIKRKYTKAQLLYKSGVGTEGKEVRKGLKLMKEFDNLSCAVPLLFLVQIIYIAFECQPVCYCYSICVTLLHLCGIWAGMFVQYCLVIKFNYSIIIKKVYDKIPLYSH
jgi:hypothetical protein